MHRILLLLALCATTLAAQGFEDPQLAVTAAQTRQQTLTGDAAPAPTGTGAAATPLAGILVARQARRLAHQGRWDEAIARYRQAIARGADDTATWLGLAESWTGKQPKQASPEALRAAYNAYSVAQVDGERAEALFVLAEGYERANRFRHAMAAYTEALGLQEDPTYRQRLEHLRHRHAFRFTGVEVESDSARPRICLRFSAPLAPTGGRRTDFHYQDYLVFDPTLRPHVTARDRSLCVAGVEHGRTYRVQLRAGLPSADGERITKPSQFDVQVPDRAPSVAFRGSAYVLPRGGPRNLPLTTVNLDRVEVRLLRINDRNLIQQINERRIAGSLDGYRIREIADTSGTSLWQGEMAIRAQPNREVTTGIPIDALLPDPKPGIHIVTAHPADGEEGDYRDRASQWLVVSDLGLTTIQGEDGLHVFVRSLTDAEAMAGIDLRLLARNNGELGRAVSDVTGHVRFDPGLLRGAGGRAPAALMAYGEGGDFIFLDLTTPAFDLGDRGVGGRPAPGPTDAYLYTDRGVYRPGEAVQLMTLLRDGRGHAIEGLPLSLKLHRPDGVLARTLHPEDQGLGAYGVRLPIPAAARTGVWKVSAYLDPEAGPVGSTRFQVEDFVPQRLSLAVESEAETLAPGQAIQAQVAADYLYGAPGARLPTRAEVLLRRLTNPYPDHAEYRFGLPQETWTAKRIPLPDRLTDAQGRATIPLHLDLRPDTSIPLKADLRVTVSDPGGRPVTRSLSLPYRRQPFAIGIRPGFADDRLAEGRTAGFQVVALDPLGRPLGLPGLRYELIRERIRYHWYRHNQRWDYKRIVEDAEPVDSGPLAVSPETPARIDRAGLEWGRYRLEVYDPASGIASGLRFQVGWQAGPDAGDTPDELRIRLEQPRYRAGETARIHVQAPFAGKLLLSVAGERLWHSAAYDLPAGGTRIELPVEADWSPGVYLLANAFRPAAATASDGAATRRGQAGPGRAIGVAWLRLDTSARTLDIDLSPPERSVPRRALEVPVQVRGAAAGEQVFVTLAAVDEGILQLTDFPSPDPVGHYFGKRRLGVEIRDLYGRLIHPTDEPLGKLRSGGGMDGKQLAGLQLRSTETVALFQGPVRTDAEGRARIPLDLPDFNGRLRLMAVAYGRAGLGRAETSLTVRDPLLSQLYLPRFLAPRDRAQVTLRLDPLDLPAGDYSVRLRAEGAVTLEGDGEGEGEAQAPLRVAADPAAPRPAEQRRFTLAATAAGIGTLGLAVDGPDGFALRRTWSLQVRPAQPFVTERLTYHLAPGAELRIGPELLADLHPAGAELRLVLSARPDLDVPGLLADLDRYPYGCTEQTTSRALPLLYADRVARRWGLTPAADTRARVQGAISSLLSRQQADGGFNLWGADDPGGQWLAAYAGDFLWRAAEARHAVPDTALERALAYLEGVVAGSDYEQPATLAARAYALHVLAKAHRARLGDLRYLFDNYLDRLPSPLALAQLGAALRRYGDQARATLAFARAAQDPPRSAKLRDYGSALRDRAAVLALFAAGGAPPDRIAELADRLATDYDARAYTSTQEQAWLLLAADAIAPGAAGLDLTLDDRPIGRAGPGRHLLAPDLAAIQRGLRLRNRATTPAWVRVSLSGIPRGDQPPEQSGYRISRRFHHLDGRPADLARVRQNDLLVAVIQGQALDARHPHSLVVDLLPAGLEIENARLGGRSRADLNWLPDLSRTRHVELRDDRYVAALALSKGDEFHLAYLVRAVTPGHYRVPAVWVEDMYRPAQRGRGATDQLSVSAAE